MVKSNQLRNVIPVVFLPLLLISSLLFLTQTSVFQQDPSALSIGITLDLLVTLPVVYFLLIRKKGIPKFTVITVFVLGLIVATLIIPTDQQTLLQQIKTYFLPVLEIGIVSLVFYKTRQVARKFKKESNVRRDFYETMTVACNEVLPSPFSSLLASEVAVIYYLFTGKTKQASSKFHFTYHKRNGLVSLLVVFIFIILLETFAAHLIVGHYNIYIAWVLTAVSLYTCIQVIALLRSIPKRPIFIDVESRILELKFGFFHTTKIPLDEIKLVESNRKKPIDVYVEFSPFGMLDPHNVIIQVRAKRTLFKMYGLKKEYTTLTLTVDKPEQFITLLREL